MRPDQLGDLAVFAAIASDRSFTRAARRLGVTQSALSQTMKRLEGQLGFRLLSRTTRSVAPTAAGERLLATLSPALAGLDHEIEALSQARGAAIGTVRITTGKHAADTVLWPMLPSFMRLHPGIEVEVCVDSGMTDVVAGRYDAGIRLGERLEKDMIALPVGPPLRVAVVAAPGYLSNLPTPMEPADLTTHRCIAYGGPHGDLSPWSRPVAGRYSTTATCWWRPPLRVSASSTSWRIWSPLQLAMVVSPVCWSRGANRSPATTSITPIGRAQRPSSCSRSGFALGRTYEVLVMRRYLISKLDLS
jgi:DNA-binding transcriptional LysR family regulator